MKYKLWRGRAWRAPSGYWHGNETVADVIRFERNELGNVQDFEHITTGDLIELDKYLAYHSVRWVTRTRKDAERYGYPEPYEIPEPSTILAQDGDGGYLVLLGVNFTKG